MDIKISGYLDTCNRSLNEMVNVGQKRKGFERTFLAFLISWYICKNIGTTIIIITSQGFFHLLILQKRILFWVVSGSSWRGVASNPENIQLSCSGADADRKIDTIARTNCYVGRKRGQGVRKRVVHGLQLNCVLAGSAVCNCYCVASDLDSSACRSLDTGVNFARELEELLRKPGDSSWGRVDLPKSVRVDYLQTWKEKNWVREREGGGGEREREREREREGGGGGGRERGERKRVTVKLSFQDTFTSTNIN